MNHLSPEQLTDAYYGEADERVCEHLQECGDCAGEYQLLREVLDAVRQAPTPEPEPDYERRVWVRLLPRLPQQSPVLPLFLRLWVFTPVLAALLAIAFLAGMLTQQHRLANGVSTQARGRVLLISLSDHLERSQVLLTELLNASPATVDLAEERSRARDLLEENRLLRQASAKSGQMIRSNTLDDLERVLLDIANSPADPSRRDLQTLQKRIQNDGLLFKVRITSAGIRHEGHI